MSDYAIKNFMDVENYTAGKGFDGIDARFTREFLQSDELGVSYFRYDPGVRAPYGHRHAVQEEAYVVAAGSGKAKLDDAVIELRRWDVLRVAPQVARGFEGGPEGMTLIAIGGRRPAEGDGEMLMDWWVG